MSLSEWSYKKLSEVTLLIKDGTHGTHKDVIGGVPLLSAKDIYDGAVHFGNNPRCISESDFNSIHKNYELKQNDILLTVVGTIGRTAIIKDLSRTFTIQRSVALIRLDNTVLPEYCYQYFTFSKFQDSLTSGSQGLAQVGVYLAELGKKIIPVPPLNTQQKITSILMSVDEAIKKTDQIIKKTEELKAGLIDELLEGGVGHTKFKKTNVGKIPEDWEIRKLSEVCDVRDGTHESPKYVPAGYPLITSKNLTEYGLDFTNIKYISEMDFKNISRRSKVDIGDILFGMIGTIGKPIIVNSEKEFSIKNVALIKFFEDSKIDRNFLLQFLKSRLTARQFAKMQDGSTQKFVSLSTIRNLTIVVPNIVEQRQISDIIESVDKKIILNIDYKDKLLKLKTGLMSDIFSQKVQI